MTDRFEIEEAKKRLQNKSLDELLSIIQNHPNTSQWTEAEVQAAIGLVKEKESKGTIDVQDKYKGVKGWLLFFAIFIGIFIPIGAIYNASKWEEVSSVFNSYPGLQTFSVMDIAISFIVSLFGIYTAFSLWKIKPGCVKLAKTFIITYAACSLLLGIYMLSLDLPQQVHDSALRWMILRVVFAGIWYLYFMKSKRIKATYQS